MNKPTITFLILSCCATWTCYSQATAPQETLSSERIAYYFIQKDNTEKAIEEYELILLNQPENHKVRYNLGLLYAQMEYYYLAIKELKKVSEKDSPLRKDALYNLAILYGKYLNDVDNGIHYYRQYQATLP